MKKSVNVSFKQSPGDTYRIAIGIPFASIATRIIREHPAERFVVITDANVGRKYGRVFIRAMRSGGARVDILVVPAGERSKSRSMKERLEDRLVKLGVGRDAFIVALGGGMIGDLAGFVAATYLRGMRLIQVPTTLLSQVDSSIGGKVAVNHPRGKNLIGAFYHPRAVYIDSRLLSSLPAKEFASGLAEVVKYGAILDSGFFSYLERNAAAILKRNPTYLTAIISRCCELKRDVVRKDERESSYRRILNFGHTIGHAVENHARYRIPHGYAVSIGMSLESKMAVALGLLSASERQRLLNLLSAFRLPTGLPRGASARSIVRLTSSDKKMHRGLVRYTLIRKVGRGKINVSISSEKALRLLGV